MKNERFISQTLKEWADEYAEYQRALEDFNRTSRFLRWFKDIREPKHPNYHCIPIVRDYINDFVVELRCYDGLYLAINVDGRGFKYDLQSGAKTPLLGSKGMDIGTFSVKVEMIADDIHNLAYNDDNIHIQFYTK